MRIRDFLLPSHRFSEYGKERQKRRTCVSLQGHGNLFAINFDSLLLGIFRALGYFSVPQRARRDAKRMTEQRGEEKEMKKGTADNKEEGKVEI